MARAKTPAASPSDPPAPEVRAKRPVYRTYGALIRMVCHEAAIRVQNQPRPEPRLTVTPAMRAWARELMGLRRRTKQLETQLRRVGAYLTSTGQLQLSWERKRQMQEKPSARRKRQVDAIRALRIQASLDTIDMTPAQVKDYLQTLDAKLARI